MKRTTLVSLVICIFMGLAATLTLRRHAERGMQRLGFSGLKIDRVDHIEISGAEPVTLFKDGDTWRLANGREADADAVAVLLRTVVGLESSDHVAQDAAALEAADLAGPKATRVRLLKETRVLADLTVGGSDGLSTWVGEGARSFRVAHLPAGVFNRPSKVWLQRKLFAAATADIRRVDVTLADASQYALQPDSEGVWQLDAATALPAAFRFDAAAAGRLVTSLAEVRAEDILEADPGFAVTHLDKPIATLTLHLNEAATALGGAPTQTLKLGAAHDGDFVYATVAGRAEVYTLPRYVADVLQTRPTDMRDMTLMAKFDLDAVQSFTIVDGNKQMTVEHTGDTWQMAAKGNVGQAPMLLDRGKVLGRLRQVMGVHGVAIAKAAPSAAKLSPRQGQIVVTLADHQRVTLQFGIQSNEADGEPSGYYVRGNIDDHVYILQKGIRNNLLAMGDSMKSSATGAGLSALGPDALKNLPPDVRRAVEAQMAQQAGH